MEIAKMYSWADDGVLVVTDGKDLVVCSPANDNGGTPHAVKFEDGGWGERNGKTLVMYIKPVDFSQCEFVRETNGIKFYFMSYSHGSHIADRCYYQIATRDNKVLGVGCSDPWSNPDSDFADFQVRMIDKFGLASV